MKRRASHLKKPPNPKAPAAETLLQRRRLNADGPKSVPPIVHDVLHSPGQPLDSTTRTSMEARFGKDFSQVRVHADENAGASARAMDANAYTVGRDVVFAAGKYKPETLEGKKLVAHELTHVVQQTALPGAGGSPAQAEIEADRSASNAHSSSVQVGVALGAVQQQPAGQKSTDTKEMNPSEAAELGLALEGDWKEYFNIAIQGTAGIAGLKAEEKAELTAKIADQALLFVGDHNLRECAAAKARGELCAGDPTWTSAFKGALQTTSGSTYKPLANKNKAMEEAAKKAVSEAGEIADAAARVSKQARHRIAKLYVDQSHPPDATKKKPEPTKKPQPTKKTEGP